MHTQNPDGPSSVARQRLRIDVLILLFLLACNVSLVSAFLLPWALLGRIFYIFALDSEGNIPAWWSSVQLLIAGMLLLLVAQRTRRVETYSWALALLGGLLVLMSADETIGLHERLGIWLGRTFGSGPQSPAYETGLLFVVVSVPVITVALTVLKRLGAFRGSVPGTRRNLLIGFIVLLVGSASSELLTFLGDSLGSGVDNYILTVAVEEFLELSGGSLILWASLLFAREHWSTQALRMLFEPSTHSEKRAYERMRAFEAEQDAEAEAPDAIPSPR
ncbi:hypothetical protein [Chthonobacter rhizosphaerae]|uniref:hypothetical protein n=1 Tax=Chthonobacter rhizosphaerae TaxID=2735553 RepID=UPI0015EE5770|nr:hypothetical protein [Chthonobacter rhizosphaerae]